MGLTCSLNLYNPFILNFKIKMHVFSFYLNHLYNLNSKTLHFLFSQIHMNKTLPNIGGDTVQPLANPGTDPCKEIPLVQRGRTPAGNPVPVQPQPTPNHITLNVGLVPQYVLVH